MTIDFVQNNNSVEIFDLRRVFNKFFKKLHNKFSEKPQDRFYKRLEIAILSNGLGYTTPEAIKAVEKETKNKARLINFEIPPDIDPSALNQEIEMVLGYIERNEIDGPDLSRPAAFIDIVKNQSLITPICLRIITEISEIAQNLDCILLPGGENIPRIWYDPYSLNLNSANFDHYRTIVELVLIHEARYRGIPLMGICRGHQIIHVYHGKAVRNCSGHFGVQTFSRIDQAQKGLLANLFIETVLGASMHEQGISLRQTGNEFGDLEPVSSLHQIVKAAQPKHGGASPVISIQFHPELFYSGEYYSLSANNRSFFKILSQAARVRSRKKLITPELLVRGREQLKKVTNQLPEVANQDSSSTFSTNKGRGVNLRSKIGKVPFPFFG